MSETLSFSEGQQAVAACLKAGRVPYLIGPPGVGKTSCVRAAAAAAGLPCLELIGSTLESVDVAGLPVKDAAGVIRHLFPMLRAVVDAPGVLFLDELTACPGSVQSAFLRVMLDRVIGDFKMHPESRVVAAGNPPDQAPGGVELTAASINRIVPLNILPTLDEVRAFFDSLGPEGSPLRAWGQDFSATLGAAPDLITFDPPRASIDSGEPWASPRAWETAIRVLAEAGGVPTKVRRALLHGAVGKAQGVAFLAILDLRKNLPSIETIVADPQGAEVPHDRSHQIASIGLLPRVADRDVPAAWIYAARLDSEIAVAAARALFTRQAQPGSRWIQEGLRAKTNLLGKIEGLLSGGR